MVEKLDGMNWSEVRKVSEDMKRAIQEGGEDWADRLLVVQEKINQEVKSRAATVKIFCRILVIR